jgi:hypothetical protein
MGSGFADPFAYSTLFHPFDPVLSCPVLSCLLDDHSGVPSHLVHVLVIARAVAMIDS